MKTFNHGQKIVWNNLLGTVQAWQDIPGGMIVYCSFEIEHETQAYWVCAEYLRTLEEMGAYQDFLAMEEMKNAKLHDGDCEL